MLLLFDTSVSYEVKVSNKVSSLGTYVFRIQVSRDAASAYISLLFSDASVVFRNFSYNQFHSSSPVLLMP